MAITVSVSRLGFLYGAVAFMLMVIYFFVCNALGLQGSEAVRFSSHVFTVVTVFLAIRAFKARTAGPAPYFSGLALGFLVGLVGSVLFAAFVLLYAKVFNPAYGRELQAQMYFGSYVSSLGLAAAVILLGTIIGGMTGFILMMSDGTDGRGSRMGMSSND